MARRSLKCCLKGLLMYRESGVGKASRVKGLGDNTIRMLGRQYGSEMVGYPGKE